METSLEEKKRKERKEEKNFTGAGRHKDTQKFQRHIHIVNLFFRKSRRTRRGKVDLQDEKIAPKIQHSEKRKHFMPPLPSPQRDNIHFQRGLSCPQHFLRKHVTPSKGLLTLLKRQNAKLLNLCLSPYISASPFLLICDFKHLWRG